MIKIFKYKSNLKNFQKYRIEQDKKYNVSNDLQKILIKEDLVNGFSSASASTIPEFFTELVSYNSWDELKKNINDDLAEEFL